MQRFRALWQDLAPDTKPTCGYLPDGFRFIYEIEPLIDRLAIKQVFADIEGAKPCGMKRALQRLKIPLEGRHHRATDDARNIAKIARIVLPPVERGR